MFSISLTELAEQLKGKLHGDGKIIIYGVSSIDRAQTGQITFLSNKKWRKKLKSCKASAIILEQENLKFCSCSAIIVDDPYLSYAKTAQLMDTTPKPVNQIHPSSIISPKVFIGKRVSIGPNTIIESGSTLEDDAIIGPGCFIGKNTRIGAQTRLWANVSIYHNIVIGKKCSIHSGTVIGSDGFGYANDSGKWIKIPQLGKVIVGDEVEIGACTSIDRGTLDDTYIGEGVIIDNQCQIAHNVTIGENTAIAGGVIIAGNARIGKDCMIGGASVINGHITICDKSKITGMSMVVRSINESGTYSSGMPAQQNTIWKRTTILLMNISKIYKKIKNIEKKLISFI